MESLKILQDLLKAHNYDAYIIPSSDFHGSEYLSAHFKARAHFSGFTGSAGTLLVMQDRAYLWTDGRYFIQASIELEGSGINLMKMGEEFVLSLEDFLKNNLKDNQRLAFDGRLLSASYVKTLKEKLPNIEFVSEDTLISEAWFDRPSLPFSTIYLLSKFFTGKTFDKKLQAIRNVMKDKNANAHILTSLEDQAWLYNLRAADIEHTPVFLAYTYITNNNVILFVDPNKIDLEIDKYLNENEIIVKPYFEIYEFIKGLKGLNILIDENKVNYHIYQSIENQNNIINAQNPTLLLKSIKNDTEIKNIKLAHIKDGVATFRFMKYLKEAYNNGEELDEILLSNYMDNLRKDTKGYVDLSFNTICAFGPHAAMMHYSATPSSNAKIKTANFLLIDSGGHYLEGTTDITRTYALGDISKELKKHYTLVLKAVINLASAIFLEGCNGQNLDILARGPIWNELIDYKCGTGHGVGYLLSVHEAPNGFRWKIVPERNDSHPLVPGMITTDEPGIYLENKYGIRIENELLCVDAGTSEFGHFLKFETITYSPIDLDAVDTKMLTAAEKKWLNNYHKMVYDTLSSKVKKDELETLQYFTREIK